MIVLGENFRKFNTSRWQKYALDIVYIHVPVQRTAVVSPLRMSWVLVLGCTCHG